MPSKRIDDTALRRMWGEGLSSQIIAERFGVMYPAVNRRARELGLTARPAGRAPSARRDRSSGYLPTGVQANDAAQMSASEILDARLEGDAVRLLETVLRRTRWTVQDRDAIAANLSEIVSREQRFAGGGR